MASFTASDSGVGVSVVNRGISVADAATGTTVIGRGIFIADTAHLDDFYAHPPVLRPISVLAQVGLGVDAAYLNVIGAETGTGVDNAFMVNPSFVTQDFGTGVDAIGDRTISITDAGTGVDAIDSLDHAVADNGLGMDVVIFGLVAVETGTGVDAPGFGVERWQLGVGSDTATLAASQLFADTASGFDSGSVGPVSYAGSDTATSSGSLSLSVLMPAADTGTGSDFASPGFSASDYPTGTDAATMSVVTTGADAGLGTDSGVTTAAFAPYQRYIRLLPPQIIRRRQPVTSSASCIAPLPGSFSLPPADIAAGSDAASVGATTAIADSATGTDSCTPGFGLGDEATGVEVLALAVQDGLSDTASGSDTAATTAILPPAGDFAISSSSATTTANFVAADNATGIDIPEPGFGISEYGYGNDVSMVVLTLADVGHGVDWAAAPCAADYGVGVDTAIPDLGISDIGTGIDVVLGIGILGAENGTGLEFVSMGVTVDGGIGVDSLVLDPSGGQIDYATGSDVGQLDVGIDDAANDTGVGTDTAAVVAILNPVGDHGTGTDGASFGILATCNDFGTGTDAGMPMAWPIVYPEEQGTFLDSGVPTAEILGDDSGTGLDAAGWEPPGALVVPNGDYRFSVKRRINNIVTHFTDVQIVAAASGRRVGQACKCML